MAFTYDPSTSNGKIRMLINDRDENNPIYQDAEIAAFLDMEGDVRRAAAAALEAIASDQAMVLKVIRIQDLSTDGAKVADALRAHARQLRADADTADAADGSLFDIAEMNVNAFTAREIVRNEALRE